MSPETSAELWFALYSVVALAVLAALSVGAVWLHNRAKTSKWMLLMEQLWALAQSVVAHVEAKVRPTLKSSLADGKLDAAERARIQAVAMAAFKEALGREGEERLKKALSGVMGGSVEVFLSGLLERAFKAFKTEPVAALPVVKVAPQLGPLAPSVAPVGTSIRP